MMITEREIMDESLGDAPEVGDLYARMRPVFPCSECGRLWVYWNGFDGEPRSYAPESD
jgi:hypothetical protein